ncbi:MAG: right-handed parallel beta-helix repeat-containing protein [Lentisphaeria bacterium]|nr:right-handed parallel beta-helix repeat-containing protein [Lentisphaeria bacterium]
MSKFFLMLVSGMLFFALGGAEFFLDPVRGRDSNPGTRSAPWKTLQTAKITPGDRIVFLSGVYPPQKFEVNGAPGKPITFATSGKVFIDGGKKSTPAVIKGAWLRFEGITFRNSVKACVLASGSSHLTFDKVTVEGGSMGFWLSGCKYTEICNSDVENVSDGIYIDCCFRTTVRGCRIGKRFHGRRDGICVYAPGSLVVAAGGVKNVKIVAPGKAILENASVQISRKIPFKGFHTVRRGELRGPADDSASGVLLFKNFRVDKENTWDLGENHIKGGKGYFGDDRPWLKLVNNPEWGNKPYSPDGTKLMFDPKNAAAADLAQAKFAMIAFVHPLSKAKTVDTLIEGNIIDGCGRQGIRTQRAYNTLIRNNIIRNCGATGIQLESTSFNTLVTGNSVKDHNRFYRNETGVWVHENVEAVVENNKISGCQKGMGLTQSYRCIVRFNTIENNRAQHIPAFRKNLTLRNVNGIYMTGGNYRKVGLLPGCSDNGIVCNTFRNNGVPESRVGVFAFGFPILHSPPIGKNIFAYNNISGDNGPVLVSLFKNPGIQFFSNQWPEGKYTVVHEDYKKKIPFKEWVKSEKKRPLAQTSAAGKGKCLTVDNPELFYAGFSFSDGKKITPGDMIRVGNIQVRVVKVDIPGKKLYLDRSISWNKNTPVQYACISRQHKGK